MTTLNAGGEVERQDSHSLLVEMQDGTDILKDSLVVSYKIKHTLTIQLNNCAPWCLLPKVENLCSHKNLHMQVYNNFIHNCLNLKAMKLSYGR